MTIYIHKAHTCIYRYRMIPWPCQLLTLVLLEPDMFFVEAQMTLRALSCSIEIFRHLKLCSANAIHDSKWVKITWISKKMSHVRISSSPI